MAKPPSAPRPVPKSKDDLAEVERALSILGGHHPEHERVRREAKEALANKRADDKIQAQKAQKHSLRRVGIVTLGIAAALAVGYWIWTGYAHSQAVERALEAPTLLFAERGFSPISTGEKRLEEAIGPGCYVAVTPSEGDGLMEVERGGETLKGERSIGWCACTPEKALVKSNTPLRLLRVDGKLVGNIDGLSAVEPRPRVMSSRAEDCAPEQLDTWLNEKKAPLSPVDPSPFERDAALAPLRSAGFAPLALLPKGSAFSLIDGGAATCFVAWSSRGTDFLTLRLQGGARPIAAKPGSIAWCSEKARLVTVWRQGQGDVLVVSTQAARVGGLLGVRERTFRAKLPALTAWIATDELAWDAVETLRGSAVAEATIALEDKDPESRPGGDARIVAISMAPGGGFAADRRGDIPYFCHPKTDAGALQTVCGQLAAQTWRQTGALGSLGIAQAPLPFWLSVFSPVKDPELARSLVALLLLSRRLRGDGFEPTTLAGVVEEDNGVRVVGRAGDDAVVAVGLGPKAPWVFPYSDGEEWQLAGEPRIVDLAPGERAILTSVQTPTVPKEQRRTVVFRRPRPR